MTDAASDIGRATALRLAADAQARGGKPAQLMLVDISADGLATLVEILRSKGVEAVPFVGDLSDAQVPAQLVAAAIEAFGGLDVLISNAGTLQRGTLLETSSEGFDRAFAINTLATWGLGKAAHPWLAQSRSSLIAKASISGGQPTPLLRGDCASKAALVILGCIGWVILVGIEQNMFNLSVLFTR
ncbi:SDR family NAD(P)-dependent oxidoreductase [Pseudomonas sp. LB3P14]